MTGSLLRFLSRRPLTMPGAALLQGHMALSTALFAVNRPAARHAPVLRLSIDPRDARRTVISGRMNEVCDALDALIHQQAQAAR